VCIIFVSPQRQWSPCPIYSSISYRLQAHPRVGEVPWLQTLTPKSEINKKKHVLWARIYQVSMSFTFRPKSDTEIGWWLVHLNIEKYNKNWGTCRYFFYLPNFSCNLTIHRLGYFDMVFITHVLKSNINYMWPQGQPPHPSEKFWVCLWLR
jgi:hypothetical protein